MASLPEQACDLAGPTPAQQLWQLWRQGQQPDVRDFLARGGERSPAEVAAVLLVDQRERWRQGERRLAETYLEMYPRLRDDFEYALELIYGEFLLRLAEKEDPDLADYAHRFPAFAERLKVQVELHRALGEVGLTSPSQSTDSRSTGPAGPAPGEDTAWPAPPGHEITGRLGQGGMGVVYRARDLRRQRVVALKTLQRLDPAALYRLKQEFRALTDVSHPNLIHFHELLSDGKQWFLSMELIEGVNFLAHVRPGFTCPAETDTGDTTQLTVNAVALPRLRAALRQLATGVAALHGMGKLHRDIKPSNVLVAGDGRVVLLDFGLAGELDRGGEHLSGEGNIAGTAAYMAPEQAAGQALTPASDWYSVGVVLYEALTGQLPFTGNALRMLRDKQQAEPPPPRTLAAGVPDDLDQLCAALLRRSPEARPTGAEVLSRLGGAEADSVVSVPGRREFVGRAPHLAALREAFEASQRGRPVTVLVQGRSGTGKSLLVGHFLSGLLEGNEAVVLAGKCYERESVPYKALDSLVDALSRYLARLPVLEAQALLPREVHLLAGVFPVLQRVEAVAQAPGKRGEAADPKEARRRAFAALRELLSRLGDRRPLILFIDDLQWGDEDSAVQLVELLRPPDAPALLLVGCYRSEEPATSPCLRLILATGERRELTVEPLTQPEARELALALLGPDDPSAAARAESVARESGGNPFFIQVLAQGDPGSVASGSLTLDQVLWARLQALPEEARRLLEVIAVSGQPLPGEDAFAAAGLAAAGGELLARLRSGRLVRSAGPAAQAEVETYHDRIRETVLAHLAADARKEHHRRLALVLEQAGSRNARRLFDLAYHFDAAGDSRRALPFALAAAEQARARHALQVAEQLYQIAARGAAEADEATRYRVAGGLGEVLMFAGRYDEAEPQFLVARELAPDDAARAHIEGERGDLAFKRGDGQASTEALRRALRLLGYRVPRRAWMFPILLPWEALVQLGHTWFPSLFLARRPLEDGRTELKAVTLHTRLAQAYWFLQGKAACLWSHLRALNLAERYPPTRELARMYAGHAPVMSMLPLYERGIAYAEKAMAIHETIDDPWGRGQALEFYGVVLHAASRFEECIEKSRAAITQLKQTGDPWQLNCSNYQIAVCLYRLGDLGGAIEHARRLHEEARAIGDALFAGISLSVWARASGGRVPADVLRAELDRPSNDPQRTAQVWQAEAMRLLAADQREEAVELLERAVALVRRGGVRNCYVSLLNPWLATTLRLTAGQAGSGSESRRLLRRARAAARRGLRLARSFRNDLPHALRESALLEALRGRAGRARRLFDEGLAVAEAQGARYEHAQTLLARGETGQKLGWPDAANDETAARQALRALEAAAHAVSEPSLAPAPSASAGAGWPK